MVLINKKRVSIRKKMQTVLLILLSFALLLTTSIGIISMINIQNNVLEFGQGLGNAAADKSETALIDQMEHNLLNLISSKASLADEKLGTFSNFISMFSNYTELLYQNPDRFVPVHVLPPDKENKGILSMQRYLAHEEISLDTVIHEIELLGNLTHVFDPVIREYEHVITTIYVSTESGFLLSYDANADLGDSGAAEEYYDFTDSFWYRMARDAGRPVFTDTYLDGYGRGLTISCAAPFYDNGTFKGVVSMDVLITDLNNSIIDIDISPDSYAFLLDLEGDIIASPTMDLSSEDYINILKDSSTAAYPVANQILSGNTGTALSPEGIYFAYTPVRSASWTLVIQVLATDITEPALEIHNAIMTEKDMASEAMRRSILLAITFFCISFAVILAIAVISAGRFSRHLTDPMIALREDVATISAGNLDYRVTAMSNDEIGDLALAFNDMTDSLQSYITHLTAVTAEKERIGAELNVATQIQASMLPCIFPAFPERSEFDIYASMQPAKEVGGDFYDFFLINESTLAMVIADVSGKGVPAALFMVIAKTLIKNNAQYGKSPQDVFETVNNMLCENNEAGMFVTAFLAYLDLVSGKFTFVNAGHNPPLLRDGERFEWLKMNPGFILAGMEDMSYAQFEITLNPGAELFLYTDGVTEALNQQDELFSDPRLLEAVNHYLDLPLEEFTLSIKKEIDKFAEGAEQADDITMLTLRYKGL